MQQVEKQLEEIQLQSLEISTWLPHLVGKRHVLGGANTRLLSGLLHSSGHRSIVAGLAAMALPSLCSLPTWATAFKKCYLKKDFGHSYSSYAATVEPHAKCFFINI